MGLTGENLKYAAENIKECRKHGYNKRRVLIVASSHFTGRTLAPILQEAYNATDIADYSGGYEDFSLCFDTVWRRDEVVNQINAAIAKYRSEHPELLNTPDPSLPWETEDETPEAAESAEETPDTPQKESPDWTTYIIIGLAAVAIVLLVWPKKKK